jgi:hypothetical protein
MTVFVYVTASKQIGDKDHVRVFANVDAGEKWFEENDPEGVAFEYEVLELTAGPQAAGSAARPSWCSTPGVPILARCRIGTFAH